MDLAPFSQRLGVIPAGLLDHGRVASVKAGAACVNCNIDVETQDMAIDPTHSNDGKIAPIVGYGDHRRTRPGMRLAADFLQITARTASSRVGDEDAIRLFHAQR